MKRVAVTGAGALCSCATSPETLWDAVMRGPEMPESVTVPGSRGSVLRLCVRPLRHELTLPEPPLFRRQNKLDRVAKLALAAGYAAWQSAGLDGAARQAEHLGGGDFASVLSDEVETMAKPGDARQTGADRYRPDEIAIIVGSARGPVESWCALADPERAEKIFDKPSWAANAAFASLHGVLCALTRAGGPCLTLASACASGGHAIALAAGLIAGGEASVALAGGADAPLSPLMLRQMNGSGILERRKPEMRPCRPFDAAADGTVPGEGAAFLVLEELERARTRGAQILAILSGWGIAGNEGLASPEAAGARALPAAAHRAMARAGKGPEDMGFVMCHGTGNPVHDAIEGRWLRAFQERRQRPVLWGAVKPVTGHCLGASPALEAVVCCEALRRRQAPPLWHLETPADYCPMGAVTTPRTPLPDGAVLSVSGGFWGAAAALVLERAS